MDKKVNISVIMSVYNAEKYVKESIESILNQTFRDFEFIIIDDASTDNSYNLIKSYRDNRIIIIQNKNNIGLTKSLNKGLKIAKGEYIARMDADDISLPHRLETQISYMKKYPSIALISCSYRQFGNKKNKNIIKKSEIQIKAELLFGSVLPHPGFMFKRSLYTQLHLKYNEKLQYAQDYDFQVKVSRRCRIACLAEPLIYYRISDRQISVEREKEQQICANEVRKRIFAYYGIKCNNEQIELIRKINLNLLDSLTIIEFIKLYILLRTIIKQISKTDYREKDAIIDITLFYIQKLKYAVIKNGKNKLYRQFT
jgi:glycosyltransferase involved in cell wall biosynthesis